MSEDDWKPGDRVRFSEIGKARSPKVAEKRGTVISFVWGNPNQVVILIDGNLNKSTYHRSYLELINEASETKKPRHPEG